MENDRRVFLAYRGIFEGDNALIRKSKTITKVVAKHRNSCPNLLRTLGEKQIVDTLKSLLERRVFQSDLEAKLVLPDLFTTSSAQDAQHNESEINATRSEAEALEDIASLDDDGDDELEEWYGKLPSSVLPTSAHAQISTSTAQRPSLYPIYIPFKIQHLVLSRTQVLLEECCFRFTEKWLPEMLERRRWDCAEAIELHRWTNIVSKHLSKIPAHAFVNHSKTSVADVLKSVNKLRHSAVHRLSVTAKGVSEMIRSATRFATVLGNAACQQQLDELHQELEGKIRGLELNKNFLETRLEQEIDDITRQRRELDEKEKQVVFTMLKEDKDYSSLTGVLLSQSVKQIFDKDQTKAADGEQSSDSEIEEHEEKEELTVNRRSSIQVPTGSANGKEPNPTQYLNQEECALTPDFKRLMQTERCITLSSTTSNGAESFPEEHSPAPNPSQNVISASRVSDQYKITSSSSRPELVKFEDREPNLEVHDVPRGIKNPTRLQDGNVKNLFCIAVDHKLNTYDFRQAHMKLSDKRLKRIRNFVQQKTKLDVAEHQAELDDIIRLRFAIYKAEKRWPADTVVEKEKTPGSSTTLDDTDPFKIDSQPSPGTLPNTSQDPKLNLSLLF